MTKGQNIVILRLLISNKTMPETHDHNFGAGATPDSQLDPEAQQRLDAVNARTAEMLAEVEGYRGAIDFTLYQAGVTSEAEVTANANHLAVSDKALAQDTIHEDVAEQPLTPKRLKKLDDRLGDTKRSLVA